LLRLHINEVFNIIKDQPWVWYLRSIQYYPSLLSAKEYCSYNDGKGHKTQSLRRYLK